MKKLHGVTVAMVTPMDSRGAFLKEAMEQLTEALIARGADCLYPCGTTVYIHAGADTPKETIELALYARQIGADGVGVVPPVFLHMSSREMQNYYLEVAGIKYSYLDLNRTLEYLQVGEDFSVLHGCDKVFASLLVLGCGGTVSGVAGVFPEPFTEVYRAY